MSPAVICEECGEEQLVTVLQTEGDCEGCGADLELPI